MADRTDVGGPTDVADPPDGPGQHGVPAGAILALPPAPPPPRPRVLMVGTSLAVAAAAMLFAGLIGTYLTLRADALAEGTPWLPEGVTIALTPPNMALVTLLMSSVTVQWAVYAIGRNDRLNTYVALGLTVVLGAAFINGAAFLLSQTGLDVRTGVGVLIFSIAGAHLAMTGAAIVFAGLMAFRTLGGQYSGRDREGIAAAALFWHATVAVYAVIWYAIYVTK